MRADLGTDGYYTLASPARFLAREDVDASVARARTGSAVLLGFDFAIGAPAHFAGHGGDFLKMVKTCPEALFEAAGVLDDVTPDRPFLSVAKGKGSQAEFFRRIGVTKKTQLRRAERNPGYRPDAKCMFWPGNGQVAGATRAGWREVLRPALGRRGDIRIWPFDGELPALVTKNSVTMVETYPGELYPHFGMRGRAKTNPVWRKDQSEVLLSKASEAGIRVHAALSDSIVTGFAADGPSGEDKFDALVGALAMTLTVLGLHACGAPNDTEVRCLEGWILCRPEDA